MKTDTIIRNLKWGRVAGIRFLRTATWTTRDMRDDSLWRDQRRKVKRRVVWVLFSYTSASSNNSCRRRRRQDRRCCFKFNEIGLSPLDMLTASVRLQKPSHFARCSAFFAILVSCTDSPKPHFQSNKPQPLLETSSLATYIRVRKNRYD